MAIRKIVSRSIGTDVIAAEDLANNSVTVAEITDGAVTEPKIGSGAVTTDKIPDDAVTTAKIPDDAITGTKVVADAINESHWGGHQISGRRNIVKNGAMQIAQRGASISIPSSSITYTLDRFFGRPNSSTDGSVAQVTDAPEGFQYSARVRRSSGQTGTLTRFETSFETSDIIRLRGQKVTISFYAKAGSGYTPSSSNLSVLLFEGDGTEGKRSISSYDNENTLVNSPKVLTTSWQRFTHTTSANIASDTTQLALQFNASWSGTAPSGDEYYITGIQLEVGETATPFEHRSYGEELALCQRYYYQISNTTVNPGSDNGHICMGLIYGSRFYGLFSLKQDMRTYPTMTSTSGGFSIFTGISGGTTHTVDELYSPTNQVVRFRTDTDGSLPGNGAAAWLAFKTASAIITLDAEL